MLIRYLREFPQIKNGHLVGRGNPIGCVVVLDKDHVGYTICNHSDSFNKEMARNLAVGRAYTNTHPPVPKRVVDDYFDVDSSEFVKVTLKDLLRTTIDEMKQRATEKGLLCETLQ